MVRIVDGLISSLKPNSKPVVETTLTLSTPWAGLMLITDGGVVSTVKVDIVSVLLTFPAESLTVIVQ